MTSTRVLTAQSAEIKTATVEIRTLTVSGRQVTQAVFRQLIGEPVVTEDGQFAGLPWGTVNYHPDKCADSSEHLHVVWQSGTDLRRACARPPQRTGAGVATVKMASELALAGICGNNHEVPQWVTKGEYGDWYSVYVDDEEFSFNLPDIWQRIQVPWNLARGANGETTPLYSWNNEQVLNRHKCAPEQFGPLLGAIKRDIALRGSTHQSRLDRWAELQALPQLFIAV